MIEKEYRRRYGVYKGLVTRWRNAGYDIKDVYTPPKKISRGSLNRLEKAIKEVRRQKDVQEARAFNRARNAYQKVKKMIEGYYDGSISGRVGAGDFAGSPAVGDARALKAGSRNGLELVLNEAYYGLRGAQDMRRFAKNVTKNASIIQEYVEMYILAAYRKKTATWSAGDGDRWQQYNRIYQSFEGLLKEGLS